MCFNLNFSLFDDDVEQNLFMQRLQKENMWPKEFILHVIEEYKKFIFLAKDHEVNPSYPIDVVWHTHLLFSKNYDKMCMEVMGRKLHHVPETNTTIKATKKNSYINTKEIYQTVYGQPPPENIWWNYFPKNVVSIDLDTHWCTPAGDWKALLKILFLYLKTNLWHF